MKSTSQLMQNVSAKLKRATGEVEADIMSQFPSMLVYNLLTGVKRYITHDYDPPWDCSGSLYSNPTNNRFHVQQYDKVRDFFVEYTGNSIASYVSGCGLFYETYEEYYWEWMEQEFRSAQWSVVESLPDDVWIQLAHEIWGEEDVDLGDKEMLICEFIEEFDDNLFIYIEELLAKIGDMTMQLAYGLGEDQAMERIRKEDEEQRKRAVQIEKERAEFKTFWPLLEKEYRLTYQKEIPKIIEMLEYPSFKQFLDQHHIDKNKRRLIAKYAPISFSNKVEFKLLKK